MVNIERFIKELQIKQERDNYPCELCYMDVENLIWGLTPDVLPAERERLYRCRDFYRDMIIFNFLYGKGYKFSHIEQGWTSLEKAEELEEQYEKESGLRR